MIGMSTQDTECATLPVEPVIDFVDGFSIEVMPRTAAKVADFTEILPAGTRVFVANIEGTPFADMLETVQRISGEGFTVVPHITARSVQHEPELVTMLDNYRRVAGIHEALLLAGGMEKPVGDFHCAMQLLETRQFERFGFERIHVAGHPEGNRDIDPGGGTSEADRALLEKQQFAGKADLELEIATQFAFDADAVIGWAERVSALGVTMPIKVGVAGPTKLQTLIKYALACGVGPSIRVIQRRARNISKLLVPFAPDEVVSKLAAFKRDNPASRISGLHIFPLGGILPSANWATGKLTQQSQPHQASE